MLIITPNIQIGLDYLGIKDSNTIEYIKNANIKNHLWRIEEEEEKEKRIIYNNRFKIPQGKSKRFYKELSKEIFNKIKDLDIKFRKNNSIFIDLDIEDYIEMNKKLKLIIKRTNNKNFGSDLQRAKAYPIENLIDFNHSGFAKCISHKENTASMKWYNDKNKIHCFGCNKSFDSIDVYMIINNCSLTEAVKNLK